MSEIKSFVFAMAVLALAPSNAIAQDAALGAREFGMNCAVCHGADGKGGGPYAELLKVSLPDLTTMKQRSGGKFPTERVAALIDGRETVAAHGTRDMPIWGLEYSNRAIDHYRDFYNKSDADRFVKSRVDGLIAYLTSIQK